MCYRADKIWIRVLLVVLVFQVSSEQRARGETLRLSPPRDVAELGLSLTLGKVAETPPGEVETRRIQIGVPVAEAKLVGMRPGDWRLVISGLSLSAVPAKPCLPLKRMVERFDPGTEILQVRVTGGTFREFLDRIDVAPAPPALGWEPTDDPREAVWMREGVVPRDRDLYASDELYPGSLVKYHTGDDGKKVSLFISCYPAQYIPAAQRLILVDSLTLAVDYVGTDESRKQSAVAAMTTAECVIITPSILQTAAISLKNFHESEEGISTDVVTTETIVSSYAPASHPPFTGYKNSTFDNRDKIQGYNYDLARRIITYLGQTADHPNLEFVVLLGDGAHVPPSYYFCEETDWGDYGYGEWGPTDFFYASPDYDLVPNFKVGRLSVSTLTEAEHTVNKLSSWYPVDWSWFQNAALVAGHMLLSKMYYGELMAVDHVNRGYLSGMNVKKRFQTDGHFDRAHVLPEFCGSNGFLYLELKGSVDVVVFAYPYDEVINDDDLMALSPSTQLPVVLCLASHQNAFDLDLCQYHDWDDEMDIMDRSFGEAVLHSNAGGIAVIGSSRSSWGTYPFYSFNSGTVEVSQELYTTEMMSYVFKSYGSGQTTLGGLMVDAINDYVAANDVMREYASIHRRTLFGFTLLGDPALLLPAQPAGTSYTLPAVTADAPLLDEQGIPKYLDLPADCSGRATISVGPTTSPSINIKHFYPHPYREGSPVFLAGPVAAPTDYVYEPCLSGYHMLRVETEDSQERWFYFNTQLEFIKTSRALLMDFVYWTGVYEEYFLDAMNGPCDVWKRSAQDPLPASVLSLYDTVICTAHHAPNDVFLESFMDYLDGGGRLFWSGGRIAWEEDPCSELRQQFVEQYLRASYVGLVNDLLMVNGNPSSWVGRGLSLSLGTGDAFPQGAMCEIDPIPPAHTVFTFDPTSGSDPVTSSGSAAVASFEGNREVIFFVFDFESIDTPEMREEIMRRIVGDLTPPTEVDSSWEVYE